MRRVLIWKKMSTGSEYDIFRGVSGSKQYTYRSAGYNVGNRLWLQGLMSSIDTGENAYTFLSDDMTSEMINSSFDFIILPMANIFNAMYLQNIRSLADDFSHIRIPVYVIACGAQADSFDALEHLIQQIGEASRKFIGAIYATGGEFALRGEFTKEFFDRLGYPTAVVTGCPSMYQLGRDFHVSCSKADPDQILPVFNGKLDALGQLTQHYRSSIFIDQDCFWDDIYSPKDASPSIRNTLAFYHNWGGQAAELLAQDRMRIIPDMHNWRSYLMEQGFNYSFGTRIHGNIMAILSGIPATVAAVDSRTREMAEFFNIPCVDHVPGHVYSIRDFIDLYERADYAAFNRTFRQKYDHYASFLTGHGIVSQINQENRFFASDQPYTPPLTPVNTAYFQKMHDTIRHGRYALDLICALVDRYRK